MACVVLYRVLGPLTSADLMESSGEGLKVAYQVLDETRVLFQFIVYQCPACVCALFVVNLKGVWFGDHSGLPRSVQRVRGKEGLSTLPNRAMRALRYCISGIVVGSFLGAV